MSPVRVLVVDDELGMRDTVADIVESDGYEVAVAGDGEVALERLRREAFDVVVMDVRMPRGDGVSVLQAIDGPPPQVIMMTAYAIERDLRAAVDLRAFAVLHKPFSATHLLKLVADAAERIPAVRR